MIVSAASPPLLLSVSSSDVYGSRTGTGSVTSLPATGIGSGGTPGYSYLWSYVSGVVMTIDTYALATTTFTKTVSFGSVVHGVYRVTVTDSLSTTAFFDINVDLEAF